MKIQKTLDSEIKRDIVNFFHRNQTTIDTAKGIATWVDFELEEVEIALEELVKSNILVAHRTTSTTGYAYTQDNQIIRLIDKHIKKSKQRPLARRP